VGVRGEAAGSGSDEHGGQEERGSRTERARTSWVAVGGFDHPAHRPAEPAAAPTEVEPHVEVVVNDQGVGAFTW
jgi:hypothetical protein